MMLSWKCVETVSLPEEKAKVSYETAFCFSQIEGVKAESANRHFMTTRPHTRKIPSCTARTEGQGCGGAWVPVASLRGGLASDLSSHCCFPPKSIHQMMGNNN